MESMEFEVFNIYFHIYLYLYPGTSRNTPLVRMTEAS
jgi:hypothetical protein